MSTPTYPTEQQRRILWTTLSILAVMALLGVGALVFVGFIGFLSWSYPILLPIGLAIIIALFLEPVVDFFQRRGLTRARATLAVSILSLIAFLLFWSFILPTIYHQSYAFFRDLPDNLNKAAAKLQSSVAEPPPPPLVTHVEVTPPKAAPTTLTLTNAPVVPAEADHLVPMTPPNPIYGWLNANLPAIETTIQKNVAGLVYSALGPVGQAFGFVLGFGFVPIYVYYFLADQEVISRRWRDYVPLRRSPIRDEVVSVLAEINTSLVSYFRGQIIVAACNGVLTFLGLWVIGVPYSLVLGLMTGALSIVPFLGIIASILPALLLGYLSAKGDPTWQWLSPLLVLVVFGLVQMSESMFITPRVQSHSTGLHPLAIILGILFWSLLLPGLLGPIVAVPLTCAIVVLLRRYVWQPKEEVPSMESSKS